MAEDRYIPFSHRAGYENAPPQLQIGEVSLEHRRLIDYAISEEIERVRLSSPASSYLKGDWERVSKDFHVLFLRKPASKYRNAPFEFRQTIEREVTRSLHYRLFDMVEFFLRHPGSSADLKEDLKKCFVECRSAYRVIDDLVVPVGTSEQGEAFEKAMDVSSDVGADGARAHLIAAGRQLRQGNWSASVRESIHAVEAMGRMLYPTAKTLGPALGELERQRHLHPALKKVFASLYGYSSDEEGVRHALVFKDKAEVGEADALFMLGACASFITYLALQFAQTDADSSTGQP